MAIRKVVMANGEQDDQAGWGEPKRKRVLPDWVAYEVTQILEQNMLAGTGTGAYFGRPAAGKTGTTDNFADAWFVGYTPTLSTAVWVGYPNAQIEMRSVHGIAVAGGTFPATIWNLFVSAALAPTSPVDFPLPTSAPVWIPFEGQYQLEGALEETTSTGETETGETETGATGAEPPAPPPATTGAEPPPATTGAEPPPAATGAEPPPATTPEPPPAETGATPAAGTTG
jgi:penicillin-binding protein 1A